MPDFDFPRLKHLASLPPFRKKQRSRMQRQVTALDVDGSILRVVQAIQRGNRVSILRIDAQPLELAVDADRSDPSVLGAAIARAIAHLTIKPTSAVMGIPRAQVVLRTLLLPVLDDLRQLASMVHFQIGKDLPFRMEEAVIDFKVGRKIVPTPARADAMVKPDASGAGVDAVTPPKLEVLVAAVKCDVVDFYRQTAEFAGLKLVTLGLLPYANARCVEACDVAIGDEPIALVSLRPNEMNIDVIAQQALRFSRGAAIKSPTDSAQNPGCVAAGQPSSTAAVETQNLHESYAEAVTIEVIRSLHSYSGMDSQNPVTKIVVTGATGQERAVTERLDKRFSAPCTVLDLARALELSVEATQHASGAIAAIGLALAAQDASGPPFDFLNPKRPAVQRDLRRIRILVGIAAAAALFIAVAGLRQFLINRRLNIQQSVYDELAEAKTKQPAYQKMIRQATTMNDWSKSGRNWLEHYAYLSAILPPADEIYLTSFTVNNSGTINLSVQARSGEILAKLDKQLRAAGYEVKPLAITPGADRYGYEFRSSVELIPPDKMKIDLSKTKAVARPTDDGSLDPKIARKGGAG